MHWPDIINGSFELLGAILTWRNAVELYRVREIRGVYWPTSAFFSAWGLWNLAYYPLLGQWFSFVGGVLLVSGNLAWVTMAVRLQFAGAGRGNKQVSEGENGK